MSHDFAPLFDVYPEVIERLPVEFTSHEFIQKLSKLRQTDYIEALYAYRTTERSGTRAPFMIVHGRLAQHLNEYPSLIRKVADDALSTDIFGDEQPCTLWRKI